MSDAAMKEEVPLKTWFLRLVGRDPEQRRVQEEFEANLQKIADQGTALDDILSDIDKIHESAKKTTKKNKDLHKTMSMRFSSPPPLPSHDVD